MDKITFFKNDYWQNKNIVFVLIFSLLINIFFWFSLWYLTMSYKGNIPLHYSIYFGIDLLGNREEIFKLPFIALLIFLINFILSFILYKKEKIFSYFLLIASFTAQIFLLTPGLLISIVTGTPAAAVMVRYMPLPLSGALQTIFEIPLR